MFRTFIIMALMALVAAAAVAAAADQVATSGADPHVVAAKATASKATASKATASRARADAPQSPSSRDARTSQVPQSGKDAQASKDAQEVKEKSGADDGQPTGDVKMSGMSILGNEDAPKSLVIVPWKSARIGNMPGLSMLLDDSVQPVDKDVFMRELAYYQIRTGAK